MTVDPTLTDPFEKVCQLVARHIENDWPRLYRSLPFYPPRGNNTIDRDVYELTTLVSRTTTEEVCRLSLDRWRRFHTRAKVQDVKEALADIRRLDVLQVLEEELNPSVPEVLEEDNSKYDFLEPYLIPFMKECEKFDQLRAANKI